MPVSPPLGRIDSFDYLRTLCAVGVVIHHWKHFYFPLLYPQIDLPTLPLFSVLASVYQYGDMFVELFFALSGYVFYWLFADAIANRKLGAGTFVTARIARLYPLFFLTLIVVVLLQGLFRSLYGYDLVYDAEDVAGFVKTLFMVHMWTPKAPQIFNGPSWSLSVEIFMYGLFFVLAWFRRTGWVTALVLVILGLGFRKIYPPLSRELPSFFIGALAFMAVRAIQNKRALGIGAHGPWLSRSLSVLCVVLWGITALKSNPLSYAAFAGWGQALPKALLPAVDGVSGLFSMQSFWYVLTPLTLIVLALNDGLLNRWISPRLKWTGELSYSIYLWHFPVMLLLMIGLNQLAPDLKQIIVSSPVFLLAVLAAVVAISVISFRYFEAPMGRLIKARLPGSVLMIFRPRPTAGE
jgi:peptidoglycan/LPS O-acetylase OafA/YrhL